MPLHRVDPEALAATAGALVRLREDLQDADDDLLTAHLALVADEEDASLGSEALIDALYLASFERFAYLIERNRKFRTLWTGLLEAGVASGELRADLDVALVYRFLRDTVWVAVRWYRPGGSLTPADVADQYLTILLEGISQ